MKRLTLVGIALFGLFLPFAGVYAVSYSSWVGDDLISTGNLNNLSGQQFTATVSTTSPDYIYTYTEYGDCSGTHDAAYQILRVSDNAQVAFYNNDSCSYRGDGVLRYSRFFGTLVSGVDYYIKPDHAVAYEIYGSTALSMFNYILDDAVDPDPPEPPITDTTTRIENLQPTATTTATSTVTLSADVYVNEADFDDDLYVEFVTQRYNRRDILDDDPNFREFTFSGLSVGMNHLSTTTTFTTQEVIAFSVELFDDIPFWFDESLAYKFTNFTVIQGSAADLYFASTSNAATAYVQNYSSSTAPVECTSASSITEKALCKMGEIVANVFQTLFMPSQEALDNMANLKDLIITKPPIGYIYINANALTSISATASSTFTLESNSALMENIFTPLRNGIQAIIWFVFIVFYFIRFKNMHI